MYSFTTCNFTVVITESFFIFLQCYLPLNPATSVTNPKKNLNSVAGRSEDKPSNYGITD
jgi:hypothetical protein